MVWYRSDWYQMAIPLLLLPPTIYITFVLSQLALCGTKVVCAETELTFRESKTAALSMKLKKGLDGASKGLPEVTNYLKTNLEIV